MDIRSLELTCRALSSSLISGRALNDERDDIISERKLSDNKQERKNNQHSVPRKVLDSRRDFETSSKSNRSSKRVLSRTISSERKNERKAKRNSITCLLASIVLKCNESDLITRSELENASWKNYFPINVEELSDKDENSGKPLVNEDNASLFQGKASVTKFLEGSTEKCLNSFDSLFEYLSFISKNVDDTFLIENSNVVFSSCILDGFDSLIKWSLGCRPSLDSFVSYWVGPRSDELVTLENAVDILGLNLLQAELRMKRCEKYGPFSPEIKSELHPLRGLVETIIGLSSSKDVFPDSECFIDIKCRSYWLATTFFLWLSKTSHSIPRVNKRYNEVALDYLENAINCISERNGAMISTRHMISPSRKGVHWKVITLESLVHFRDSIMAAADINDAKIRYDAILKLSPEQNNEREKVLMCVSATVEKHHLNSKFRKSKRKMIEIFTDFLVCNEAELRNALPIRQVQLKSNDSLVDVWKNLWYSVPLLSVTDLSQKCESSELSLLRMFSSGCYILSKKTVILTSTLCKLIVVACTEIGDNRGEMSDDESSDDDYKNSQISDRRISYFKEQTLFIAINLFIDKLVYILSESLSKNSALQLDAVLSENSLFEAVRSLLSCDSCDQETFRRVQNMMNLCFKYSNTAHLNKTYFLSLVEVIVLQKDSVRVLMRSRNNNTSRKKRLSRIECRGHFIASIALSMSQMLSTNLSVFKDGALRYSALLTDISPRDEELEGPLTLLTKSLSWLWNYISPNESTVYTTSQNQNYRQLHSTFSKILKVPIASTIVALCGAVGETSERSYRVDITEFYDSDCSLNSLELKKISSTRLIMHIRLCVQCFLTIAKRFSERMIDSTPNTENGPLLPLVLVRVVTHLADIFLTYCNFNDIYVKTMTMGEQYKNKVGLWAEDFPLQSIGNGIDELLMKAYFHLHGLQLESTNSSIYTKTEFLPESVRKACQLYRCAARLHSQNSRKAIPLAVLEFVSALLPPLEASISSKIIHTFLFENAEVGLYEFKIVTLKLIFCIK